MNLNNDAEVRALLTMVLKDVIDSVVLRAESLLQEHLRTEGFVDHTGGLYNAWKINLAKVIGTKVVGELSFDPELLGYEESTYDNGFGWHGSIYNSSIGSGEAPSDVRDIFPYIMFEGKAPNSPFGGAISGLQPSRDAWTPFIQDLNKKLDTWILQECRLHGLQMSSVKGNVNSVNGDMV